MKRNNAPETNLTYVINQEYEIVYYNRSVENLFPNLQYGSRCYECFMGENSPCKECALRTSGQKNQTICHKAINRWMDVKSSSLQWPGEGECFIVIATPIKDIQKHSFKIPEMAGYDALYLMSPGTDSYQKVTRNGSMAEGEDTLAQLFKDAEDRLIHPDDLEAFREFWNFTTLRKRLKQEDGFVRAAFRERDCEGKWKLAGMVVMPSETYDITGDLLVLVTYTEIADLPMKTVKPVLEYNSLTNLPTGSGYRKLVSEYIHRTGAVYAILALDVGHFKLFNRTYGRAAGDRMIRGISRILRKIDRQYTTCSGYLGADNFCCVFPYDEALAKRIAQNVGAFVENFEQSIGFRIYVGGYVIEDKEKDYMEIQELALIAMNHSEASFADSGDKYEICWYDENLAQEVEYETNLVPKVRAGMEKGEFCFFAQPKYSVSEQRIIGAEALIRWKKDGNYVPPGKFIPVLEENGYITKLDCHIWELVCKTMSEWKKKGIRLLPISVNVSRSDFNLLAVPEYFKSLVEKYDLDPSLIEIEITESAFSEDGGIVVDAVDRFGQYGFSVLMDDFGRGYSSLNSLKDLHVDVVKMDMKFLDLNSDNLERGRSIVRSVLRMTDNLHIPVIAEGVENAQQLAEITGAGCDVIQGYYFFKPAPIEEYEKLLNGAGNE